MLGISNWLNKCTLIKVTATNNLLLLKCNVSLQCSSDFAYNQERAARKDNCWDYRYLYILSIQINLNTWQSAHFYGILKRNLQKKVKLSVSESVFKQYILW